MKIVVLIAAFMVLLCLDAQANDVEPCLYSTIPTGVQFISIGYAHSRGEVTFDGSLPVEDVESEVDAMVDSLNHELSQCRRLSGLY